MIPAFRLWNVLADAVENHSRRANEYGYQRLLEAHTAGDLAVRVEFLPGYHSYTGWNPAFVAGDFIDEGQPPCWDGCDGILLQHRPGWCRTSPAHADFDCACGDFEVDPPWPEEAPMLR